MRCRTGRLCVGYMMFRSFVELCPRLFAEVTVEEALEAAAMASLVLSHLVNRIMDSIETKLFWISAVRPGRIVRPARRGIPCLRH